MGFSGVISTTSPKSSAYDVSARGFFIAQSDAGVTLTDTQKNATNQLVIDLKAAGLWNKMKAVYPMVGGTATSHKFNLITPADTDAAFRLQFFGGWTHSANGALPNGVDAYANTFLNSSTILTATSAHLSYYSRTTTVGGVVEIGNSNGLNGTIILHLRTAANFVAGSTSSITNFTTTGSALGFWLGSKRSNSDRETYLNGTTQTTVITSDTAAFNNFNIYLGASNVAGSANFYSAKECAFATIGDGLTDLESQLFYQITEKYQVALGRNINPTQSFYYNSAYNNETNAFLFSTQITDNTIQTATNTLVNDLKTAGVFTKMKAIYPMVGGTATTHKFNLINTQDTNAAFRLNFVGGWTHSSNGALPNGTNAYADTFLIPNTNLTSNSHSLAFYSRTNNTTTGYELACASVQASSTQYGYMLLAARESATSYYQQQTQNTNAITPSEANTLGFYNGTRTSSTSFKGFKNGVLRGTNTNTASGIGSFLAINSIYLSAYNLNNNGAISTIGYSNRQCAFASIGDGLTDAEALSLYNAVQTFQTSLSRQV